MARLSPVNMPQAPYTDMPLQSGDSFDLLEKMDAVGTRRRQEEKEEFELANMAQDRDYLLQKREAELQKTQAETRRLEADTRANNLKMDAQLGAARDTINAFEGFDVGQMPPNMKQEVEEINRMLQGPLSEADEIILAGRISKAKQGMVIMRRQVDLGVDLATMNQMRFDGEPVSQAMQDVMSDLDVYQSGTYAGMDADARATFDQGAADHRAALEAEIETRRSIGRTVQQRQEWQSKYEGMNQDMLRLQGLPTKDGGTVFGQQYQGLFKKWEDAVALLKGGGFAGSSSLTYDDMQRAFNDMEQQYSVILSIADGQDSEIGNLGAQYNNALLEGDGIQKQYDTMMSNIDWMSTMLTLPGDSPFKSVAMEFLGPNMADLYSERWDDGSRWQNSVEPVLSQMKRFQELYKQRNNGVELPLGQAAQMLHEQSAKHTEIDRQLDLQYGDAETRSNIEQARDETVLLQRFAETMPDGKIEPYVGHLDPAVDDVLNAHNPNEKDAKWKRRVNDAFQKAFPAEFNKYKVGPEYAQGYGERAAREVDGTVAERAMGYDRAGGATTDWPIMMYLAQHARTEGGQARVAKFLSLLAKEPYDGEPDFRQLSYEAQDLLPDFQRGRNEIGMQGQQLRDDPEAEAPVEDSSQLMAPLYGSDTAAAVSEATNARRARDMQAMRGAFDSEEEMLERDMQEFQEGPIGRRQADFEREEQERNLDDIPLSPDPSAGEAYALSDEQILANEEPPMDFSEGIEDTPGVNLLESLVGGRFSKTKAAAEWKGAQRYARTMSPERMRAATKRIEKKKAFPNKLSLQDAAMYAAMKARLKGK